MDPILNIAWLCHYIKSFFEHAIDSYYKFVDTVRKALDL